MPADTTVPTDLERWIVHVVETVFEGEGVRPGETSWRLDNHYFRTARELRRTYEREPQPPFDVTFPLREITPARLRALAKRGLIAAREVTWLDTSEWKFSTVALGEAVTRELNLTDAERAERTAASIAERYETNQRDYADRVWGWPVDASLNAVVSDGIAAAVDAGLIHAVNVSGLGTRYVPADRYDTYLEAAERDADREQRLDRRFGELADRLIGHAGGGRRNHRTVELGIADMERLLALISMRER